MLHLRLLLIITLSTFTLIVSAQDNNYKTKMEAKDLKKVLTPMQYFVTQEKGTERPFTGDYWNSFEKGMYHCVCCEAMLFESETKFNSSCGWPSFFGSKFEENIKENKDFSHGMIRTEVLCKQCNAHLGHVFDDGPKPTGKRYCINSAALKFIPKKENDK